jgi:molybdopterin converting factor small subunit
MNTNRLEGSKLDVVTVRLPRHLKKRLGRKDWSLTLEGETTLEWVLHRLAEECDPSFQDLLTSEEARPRWVESIILNSRMITLPEDLLITVKGGDRLFFFAPVAGG